MAGRLAGHALLEELEPLLRTHGKIKALSDCVGNRAIVFLRRGDIERAVKMFREQETLCRELGHEVGLVDSLTNQVSTLTAARDYYGALRIAEEALSLSSGQRFRRNRAVTLQCIAMIKVEHDDLEEALTYTTEAVALLRDVGDTANLKVVLKIHELLRETLGDGPSVEANPGTEPRKTNDTGPSAAVKPWWKFW